MRQIPGVRSDFNCSSQEELTTLKDKLEVYLALIDVTDTDSPFQMLHDFTVTSNTATKRSSYWNSHVMNNCSMATTEEVAAAHAELSRRSGFQNLCCVHSLFDPHPSC